MRGLNQPYLVINSHGVSNRYVLSLTRRFNSWKVDKKQKIWSKNDGIIPIRDGAWPNFFSSEIRLGSSPFQKLTDLSTQQKSCRIFIQIIWYKKRLSENFSSVRFSTFMSRKKRQKNATPCQLRNKKAVQLSLSPSFTYLLTPFPFLSKSFWKSPEVGSFLWNRIWDLG